MSIYSFPHTSVDGDRPITAGMWREANRSTGQNGWANGLAVTRNSPNGVEFTVSAGTLALDGVWFYSTENITLTGSVSSGINAIIARFGNDRDIELAHVIGYAASPPEYEHILLYHDVQSTEYTLVDKRADSLVMPLLNRKGSVTNENISGSVMQAGSATFEYYNETSNKAEVIFDTPFDEIPAFFTIAWSWVTTKNGCTIYDNNTYEVGTQIDWIAMAKTQ